MARARRESVLTQREKASIQIDHFIFHIILEDKDTPIFLENVTLSRQQNTFFCERLADAAEGSKYEFQDANLSTPRCCRLILENPGENFVPQSKLLAIDFKMRHKAQMSDGVFICAIISIEKDGERVQLISMIKMDHARVLQYSIKNTEKGLVAIMNEVLNSFVEDKAAMQKVALVDAGNNFDWDALAKERNKTIGIADYFQAFLGVILSGDPEKLTKAAISVVKRWANSLDKEVIPQGQVPSDYRARAISYMETHDAFNTNEFINMVVRDENEVQKELVMASLLERLAKRGIAGQVFTPRPDSLLPTDKKYTHTTNRGVTILWTGEAEAAGITIPNEPNADGMYEIKILTRKL